MCGHTHIQHIFYLLRSSSIFFALEFEQEVKDFSSLSPCPFVILLRAQRTNNNLLYATVTLFHFRKLPAASQHTFVMVNSGHLNMETINGLSWRI